MDCKGLTHDLLLDHVEGICEQPLREPIERHLQDCAACRERRHDVERIAAGVRTLLAAPPQKALVDQLDAAVLGGLDKLALPSQPKRYRLPFWVGGIAAAAAVALTAIALSWNGSGGKAERDQEPVVQAPPPAPPVSGASAPTAPPPAPQPVTQPLDAPPKPIERPPEPAPPPLPEPGSTQPPAPTPPPAAPPPLPPDTSPRSRMPTAEPANPAPQPPVTQPKTHQPPAEPAFARGDVNGDRVVDARDVDHLDSDIREGRTPDLGRADLTGDGRVDCGDVLALLRALERNP